MYLPRPSILDQAPTKDFLFDSHCHLQFTDFDEDREEVIQRAKTAGIKKILIPATNYQDALKAIEIAEKHPNYIEVAVGNHPYQADETTEACLNNFLQLFKEHTCVTAIGETGLDNVNSPVPLTIQIQSLTNHITLAYNCQAFVIIHTRDTDELTDAALQLLQAQNHKKAVFHCFSGSLETAKKIWDKGFKTSFSGNCTYKRNTELREVIKACPPELLLWETDSPYLSPEPHRGTRNEPAHIVVISKVHEPTSINRKSI